ncbi:MAG: flagellar filament capping protein FliD [Anaerolineae bacterium]|nr:flagellar filament capping protein FliD [Anaerolineae bacterium]
MSTSVSSTGSSTYGLDSTWVSIIDAQITSEKQYRLNKLTAQKDALDIRKAVFTDLKSQINSLKDSLGKLWSTDTDYALNGDRSVTIGDRSDKTASILTATASSTASLGVYSISVENLATQHRVSSTTAVSSSTTALGYNGNFSIEVGGKSNTFTVDASDTLYSIASKINSATYESGKGVTATVVNNKLTIQSKSTGAEYKMTLSGSPLEKLGIIDSSNNILEAAQLQDGEDAKFAVNGVSVTRSSNTNLTDVISGLTINLATDSEGKSASITVEDDTNSLKTALNSFISQFNTMQTYLKNKTGFTKISDTEYQAGALARDYSVRGLIGELNDQVNFSSGSGTIKFFSDLGLKLENNQLSISDSDKLNDALENNMDAVKSFLDTKMKSIDSMLGSYVESDTSFINYTLSSIENQQTLLASNIDRENTRLEARRNSLIDYYQTLNNQIISDDYTTQALSSFIYTSVYGSSSS